MRRIRKSPRLETALLKLRETLRNTPEDKTLPSERKLAESFGISRLTLRSAIEILKREGEVISRPGQGMLKATKASNHNQEGPSVVLTMSSFDRFNKEISKALTLQAEKQNINVILHKMSSDSDTQNEYFQSLRSNSNIRGLIITPALVKEDLMKVLESLYDLRRAGIYVVFMNAPYPDLNFDSVCFDDTMGAQMVINHLISQGHQKIAFMRPLVDSARFLAQNQGQVQALEQVGLSHHIYYIKHDLDQFWKTYTLENCSLLEKTIKVDGITAIASYNDEVAGRVYQHLTHMGFSVPKDVTLTGFDKIKTNKRPLPSNMLSTYRDRDSLAKMTFNLFHMKMAAGIPTDSSIRKLFMPIELVGKQSIP